MSEVNGRNFNVNQVNFTGIQKQQQEEPETDVKEADFQYKDFSDNKAEALGRSMLVKGANDNINNDLKALLDNPQIAENSDEIFELAYAAAEQAGAKNPYELASEVSTTAI